MGGELLMKTGERSGVDKDEKRESKGKSPERSWTLDIRKRYPVSLRGILPVVKAINQDAKLQCRSHYLILQSILPLFELRLLRLIKPTIACCCTRCTSIYIRQRCNVRDERVFTRHHTGQKKNIYINTFFQS